MGAVPTHKAMKCLHAELGTPHDACLAKSRVPDVASACLGQHPDVDASLASCKDERFRDPYLKVTAQEAPAHPSPSLESVILAEADSRSKLKKRPPRATCCTI